MTELKIKIPNVAHVVITGPTQCGKSILMDRIEKVLRAETSQRTKVSGDELL